MQLAQLVDPAHTAVLVSEMQRGISGDLAAGPLGVLSTAVRDHGVVDALARLLDGARSAGAMVVHATIQYRRDRAGVTLNTPFLASSLRNPEHMLVGSDEAQVMPELGPAPADIVHARTHGLSAFTGTDLDAILRSRDIRTLVIGGVSLNEAIIGGAIEAANLGYRLVVLRDACLGVPHQFGEDMLRYAFALLGTVTTTTAVLEAWQPATAAQVPPAPSTAAEALP
ncbi:cysteine hydrolase family protein [uncultured Modestobacter sp.]|uniref:cysteine hydrolase family protein n=1 Tax=uncultured Modestobacter sp. TaxID=380048 RepID=UPI0026248AB8|nr:cysteine hydrolase family protein [uncultured Modestobacter sp.]